MSTLALAGSKSSHVTYSKLQQQYSLCQSENKALGIWHPNLLVSYLHKSFTCFSYLLGTWLKSLNWHVTYYNFYHLKWVEIGGNGVLMFPCRKSVFQE